MVTATKSNHRMPKKEKSTAQAPKGSTAKGLDAAETPPGRQSEPQKHAGPD